MHFGLFETSLIINLWRQTLLQASAPSPSPTRRFVRLWSSRRRRDHSHAADAAAVHSVLRTNGYYCSLSFAAAAAAGFVSNRSQYFPTHNVHSELRDQNIYYRPYNLSIFVDILLLFCFVFVFLFLSMLVWPLTLFPPFAFRSNTFFAPGCRENIESNFFLFRTE